jgi:hypothetical protein
VGKMDNLVVLVVVLCTQAITAQELLGQVFLD